MIEHAWPITRMRTMHVHVHVYPCHMQADDMHMYEARIYTRDIYHARTRVHLQAEDRVEVGVAVGGLIDDLAPVESLLVRALGLPLEQPW